MHNRRFLLLMLVSLLTLWLLVACGREHGSLVGTIDGTDAFIALVPQENNGLIAYVCDGQTISVWFRGERDGSAVDLTAATGVRLQASLKNNVAAGQYYACRWTNPHLHCFFNQWRSGLVPG
ncbi:MAG: hypothetical protein IPL78_20605 [Chloroflexi bacterium]|nr:hypothetical protein [Chloroflexota bacterium]